VDPEKIDKLSMEQRRKLARNLSITITGLIVAVIVLVGLLMVCLGTGGHL
jgi:heme/copper-type cytochrome/quinol oxidase subunit 4